MLYIFDGLRDLTVISVLLRFSMALLFGGLIGLSRGLRNHPAGLRTHALVCIGAAASMIVNQYIVVYMGGGDAARIGAQVISGIGFLGAGTVILTGGNQVRGLSTAAGLWASACMGLAVGIGYFEAAILMFILIFIVLVWFNKVDENYIKTAMNVNVFVEFDERLGFGNIVKIIKENEFSINEITDIEKNVGRNRAMIVNVMGEEKKIEEMIGKLKELEGMVYADNV